MNPFFYDVLRVLRNRGVLVLVVLTSLLALVALTIYDVLSAPGSPAQASEDTVVVVLIMGMIYAFFVPILGIQTGYATYARDRATGVLESILVRPISRSRLILSRYLAVVVASAAAIACALLFLDALNLLETGYALPADQLVGLYGALLAEAVSFAGVLFLIAHLLRSPGAILGSAVVVFVLIDVVWFFLLFFLGIIPLFTAGSSGVKTEAMTRIVELEYSDPAGLPFLALVEVQGGFFGGFIRPPGGLASVGLTPAGLILAGLFWSLLPFLLAFVLARKRD